MRRTALLFCVSATGLLAAGQPYLTEPSICPVRPEIAFVSGGDIWVAPIKGGEAHILVSNPADESRPLYSPDGAKLAFVSTRTGAGDVYVLTLATGELKRITFDDGLDQLDAWSRDGHWLYFSNGSNDVGRKNDIYRVSSEGGTPMPVTADRFTNEFQGAPSPDGSTLAFAARGTGDSQWWRNGHSHLDESEIWLRKEGPPASYEKIVDLNGRNAWPMWAPDAKLLYFMSDRTKFQNIWSVAPGAKPQQITKFTSGRVLWPSIAYDGKSIVFERDFRVWILDTKTGESHAVPVALDGLPGSPESQRLTLSTFTDMALSGDGRKLAVTGHGDIFVASARDGGATLRVTDSPAPESQATWSPDSLKLVYLSPRDAVNHIFLRDFTTHADTQLTNAKLADGGLKFSPDGKSLAFVRDRNELFIYDLDAKRERSLYAGFIGGGGPGGGALAWSPDSKWIAFARAEERGLRNIYVVPAAGGAPRPVTFLSNGNIGSVEWSPDGKFLLFETNQRTENPQVTRVDLVPRQPKFAEEKLDDLFKPDAPRAGGRGGAAAAEVKPAGAVTIAFDGIRERVSALPVGLNATNLKISPDGHSLVFAAAVGGQANLYLYPLDDTAPGAGGGRGGPGGGEGRGPRQLTSTAGAKSRPQFSPDSREVYYLEAGRVQAMTIDTRVARAVNLNADMVVDFDKEKMAVFEQAWAGQRDGFWDAEFNGADWNAVRRTYAPLIEASRTPDEMRRILRMMIGELNSSHSGVSAPGPAAEEGQPSGPRALTGQLGLSFGRAVYESTGKLKITAVLPHSPAALAGIVVGGELQAVDGAAIGAHVNLDELLQHKIGKRVTLKIGGSDVVIQPVGSLADLIYRNWVEENRKYVAKQSGGRLGYVHMRDMSDAALTQFYMDLDSENRAKDGVVIDIRNNNGGFVNAYALDVLTRRPYLTMTPRGGLQAPARTALGQRSLELPTILVVNQHSLSDAEDFTEGYRTLKLGKVVGEPTAGWIVYTGSMELVDGSTMRMPGTLIRGSDGKNMENNPRPVDIAITRPIGESYTGRDSQLDAAVKELLAEVGKK